MLNFTCEQVEELAQQNAIKKIGIYNRGSEEEMKKVQSIIYNLLTTRPWVQYEMEQNENFLVQELMTRWDFHKYYKKKLDEFDGNHNMNCISNPAWFQFNCSSAEKWDVNFKIYKTFHPYHLEFLEFLPELYNEFKEIWKQNNVNISFKVPNGFMGLLAGNDNLVIHFSDLKIQKILQEALDKWILKHNIATTSRNFSRTELAADIWGNSFSEYIASYYAQQWLLGYSPESVIRGAIEQSKKPNFSIAS